MQSSCWQGNPDDTPKRPSLVESLLHRIIGATRCPLSSLVRPCTGKMPVPLSRLKMLSLLRNTDDSANKSNRMAKPFPQNHLRRACQDALDTEGSFREGPPALRSARSMLVSSLIWAWAKKLSSQRRCSCRYPTHAHLFCAAPARFRRFSSSGCLAP